MAKRQKRGTEENPFLEEHEDRIIENTVEDVLADRFSRYSKYIIQERALPDARDGLKPVQRRILYAMYEAGNTSGRGYHKSAKTVGNVIGNYHPHGDTSVYDAMVRLSQNWKTALPLLDMQGNNGSMDNDPAAAMRYTECRLAKIADYMLADIHKETVKWVPNFSDEKVEPVVLPARFPNLLINGISGIASGYATNIPPHNLNEVVEAAIHRIKNPGCSLEDLLGYVKGPDFPTGGIVIGKDGLRQALETGKGKVTVRSKVETDKNQIIVTEIPYEVVKSDMVKKIEDLYLDKKLPGITDVRDESGRDGLRIVIDLKKDVSAQGILNYLYKNTDLQTTYNYNIVTIINKAPVQAGLVTCLDAFIQHRMEVVLNRTKHDLQSKLARMHILEGLIKCLDILDEVIATIRKSQNKAEAKGNLITGYAFTEKQAESIVEMKLHRLTSTDIEELNKEYSILKEETDTLKGIIENEDQLKGVVIRELEEVNETFKTPRRTKIDADGVADVTIDEDMLIPQETVYVAMSESGYLKRTSLRSQGASGETFAGHKEGDRIVFQQEASTRDNFIFITNKGRCGSLPVYRIVESKWRDLGTHISATFKMEADEKVLKGMLCGSEADGLYLLGSNGRIKCTPVQSIIARKITKMIPLMTGCTVIDGALSRSDEHLYITTKHGKGLAIEAAGITPTQTKGKGMLGIGLTKGDEPVSLIAMKKEDTKQILLISEGRLKKIEAGYYAETSRGTQGRQVTGKGQDIEGALLIEEGRKILQLQEESIDLEAMPIASVQAKFSQTAHNTEQIMLE